MAQDMLDMTVAESKAGPIALELIAEEPWQLGELRVRPTATADLQGVPLVIEKRIQPMGVDQRAMGLQTLLMVINSATLFLDRQLNIKRFTPQVREFFDILPSDQGQPLTHVMHRLGFTSLADDAFQVLQSLVHVEREIRSQRDQWFLIRLFPCRTINGCIDGVVITFSDITRLKGTEADLCHSQQQVKSLTEKLAKQHARVQLLTSEVLRAEQQAQQSVADLLHNELQQILFSIQMQMEMTRQMLPTNAPLLVEQMQKLRDTTDLAFAITRQLAVDLTPTVLLGENFMESLAWLAALMKERHGLEVALKGDLRQEVSEQKMRVFLLQMVRELLFNVVKYARVKQAQVEVVAEAGHLHVTVSDHGMGFDIAAAMANRPQRGGLGLFSIHNRLELFGGQFHIESQADQGTRATVVVPV